METRLLTTKTSTSHLISCQAFWLGKPGVLVSFGIRHLTKWGWVLLRFVINLPRFSCCRKVTLLQKSLCLHCCVWRITGKYVEIITRKRADTVWKEEPFFFAAFLVVPPEASIQDTRRKVLHYCFDWWWSWWSWHNSGFVFLPSAEE